MDSLWTPDPPGRMWSHQGEGFRKTSTRNDALWAACEVVRRANLVHARAWRDAAVADNWSIRPTYPGHETEETAWSLEREGFKVQGLSRLGDHISLPTAAVFIWAPDRLAIKPTPVYSWAAIVKGARACDICGAEDVETQRYSFAGRSCGACITRARAIYEQGNWTE